MNNRHNLRGGLGVVLLTALACVLGAACREVRESVHEEAVGETIPAVVKDYPPGS